MSNEEKLEHQKLRAEIDDIKQKIKVNAFNLEAEKFRLDAEKERHVSEKKLFSKSNLGGWAAILISFLTIALSVFTLGRNINDFFFQKGQAVKINIDREMIELVNDMAGTDENKSKNGILLLSAYGLQAVPVLLENLARPDKTETIISSLKSIKDKKEINKSEFSKLIRNKANEVFYDQVKNLKASDDIDDTDISRRAFEMIGLYIVTLKKLDLENTRELFQKWGAELKKNTVAVSVRKELDECLSTPLKPQEK